MFLFQPCITVQWGQSWTTVDSGVQIDWALRSRGLTGVFVNSSHWLQDVEDTLLRVHGVHVLPFALGSNTAS